MNNSERPELFTSQGWCRCEAQRVKSWYFTSNPAVTKQMHQDRFARRVKDADCRIKEWFLNESVGSFYE